DHAPLQIVAALRAQEIDRVAAALLLVAHDVAVRRVGLEIVDAGDRLRRGAKGRMPGDVVDLLAADIDHTSIAQCLQVLLTGAQHDGPPYLLRTRPSAYAPSSRTAGRYRRAYIEW